MRKMTNKDKTALSAIDEFERQIPFIHQPSTANSWKANIKSSLIVWLGEANELTKLFDAHEIKALAHKEFRLPNDHENRVFLQKVREYIKNHGVIPGPEKVNWIYTINKTLLNTVIGAVLTFVATGGYFVGKQDWIREDAEYRLKHDLLIDSIRSANSARDSTNNNTQNEAAKADKDYSNKDSVKH